MKRLIVSLASMLLASVLLGAEMLTGSVSGTVVDSNTGRPLGLARVRIAGTPLEVSARADGTFEFPEVPVGTYTVLITFVAHAAESTVVHVRQQENSSVAVRLRMSLLPRPVQTLITGKVVDALTGEPLRNVRVAGVEASQARSVLQETHADAQGNYVLSMDRMTHLIFTAAGYDTLQLSLSHDRIVAEDCCCGYRMKDAGLTPLRK